MEWEQREGAVSRSKGTGEGGVDKIPQLIPPKAFPFILCPIIGRGGEDSSLALHFPIEIFPFGHLSGLAPLNLELAF